jgi:hypothetical protein
MDLPRAACAALLAIAPLVVPAPALAASPFDGYWMIVKGDNTLDPGSQIELKVEKHQVTLDTPMGASYKARLDGSDAPMENDANTTSVSVRMPGANTLVQTDKNNGKPWRVTTMEMQPDGKTIKVSWKNLTNNRTGQYTLSRQ